MEASVRKWLRQQLLDADEASRTWRLRAIQAEAELRALQVDVPTSPKLGETPAQALDEGPHDMQVVLSQVLGLEKHMAELEPWRAKLQEDTQAALAEAEKLQAQLDEKRALLPQVQEEAKTAGCAAQAMQEERAKVKAANEERCLEISQEIHELLVNAGARKSGSELLTEQQGEAALRDIQSSIGQLEEDVKETRQKREELRMRLEELRTRHLNNIDTRARCIRDVGSARQALQARQTALAKLQGEVSRSRAKADRKRKQLEGQLQQLQLELSDALSRSEAAEESLRKVKSQHARQLRTVRTQTTSLQAEVDAHIEQSEAAEKEMQQLQQQEMELGNSEQQFLEREEELRNQALAAQQRLRTLEQQTESFEDKRRALLEKLRPLEEEWEQTELESKACQDLAEADSLKAIETQSAVECHKEEIAAHLKEYASQADELAMLKDLEVQVSEARRRRDQITAERAGLEDASKSLAQSLEQHLAELREAQRRSVQLKATHDDFVKQLPPASLRQVNLTTAAEQAMGRAGRKADQLQGYLEGGRQSRRSGGSSKDPATTNPGLREKLMQAAETIVKEELQECRQSLVDSQQKLVEESQKRGQEILTLRSQRRELEEELSKVDDKVHLASTQSSGLLEDLRRHMKELEEAAAKDEANVAAEFSDLKQRQALERNSLVAQVDELQKAHAEEATARELAVAAALDKEQARKRLVEVEAEIQELRAEEEELVEAHVALKATLLTVQRRARSTPRRDSRGERFSIGRTRPSSVPACSSASSLKATPRTETSPNTVEEGPPSQSAPPSRPAQVIQPRPLPLGPAIATVHTPQGASPRAFFGAKLHGELQQHLLHVGGQLLMPDGSPAYVASPDSSPRMVRGSTSLASASSLPLLMPVAKAATPAAMTVPRHLTVDSLVYTWPRRLPSPYVSLDRLDLRNLVSTG
ncbi:unnamed protein product [Effrenium voratum]|nr:unnamed protein product [Effrenium voratum]